MMCHDVTRLLPLYLDSELSPETSFAIAEHLGSCAACQARVERERKLEEEVRDRLTKPAPEDGDAWEQAVRAMASRREAGVRQERRGIAVAAAVGVAALLLAAIIPRAHGELDLARSAATDHARFAIQVAAEDVSRATMDELQAVASRTISGAVHVPAGPPAGYRILKVGRCNLDGAPVAYLIIAGSGEPVSLFLMDRQEMSRFPEAARRLAKDPGGVACDVKDCVFYLAAADELLAFGVGELSAAELERLVLWLLSG